MTPRGMELLAKSGVEFLVESGAGVAAGFPDTEFSSRGGRIAPSRATVFADAEVILQVRTLGANPEAGRGDLSLLRSGQILIGFGEPLTASEQYADFRAQFMGERVLKGAQPFFVVAKPNFRLLDKLRYGCALEKTNRFDQPPDGGDVGITGLLEVVQHDRGEELELPHDLACTKTLVVTESAQLSGF